MARALSEASIEHRVRVARMRAAALARSDDYGADIRRLRDGWEEDAAWVRGSHFDENDGYVLSPPCGPTLELFNRICRRSGLTLPWLPERLKALSCRLSWESFAEVFQDVPGWTRQPKASRRRRPARRLRPQKVDVIPASLADFESIDEERLREVIARIGRERGDDRRSSVPTLDLKNFKRVTVPLRQVGKRHHGLLDGDDEVWHVFDWHREGIADSEIARRLWPGLARIEPEATRQRVHQRLKTARERIEKAYSAQPVQRETRRRHKVT